MCAKLYENALVFSKHQSYGFDKGLPLSTPCAPWRFQAINTLFESRLLFSNVLQSKVGFPHVGIAINHWMTILVIRLLFLDWTITLSSLWVFCYFDSGWAQSTAGYQPSWGGAGIHSGPGACGGAPGGLLWRWHHQRLQVCVRLGSLLLFLVRSF